MYMHLPLRLGVAAELGETAQIKIYHVGAPRVVAGEQAAPATPRGRVCLRDSASRAEVLPPPSLALLHPLVRRIVAMKNPLH